jgi:hypothetical protein
MRNIAEITNRNTDENSNVKNGSDIKLNSELVSKFNNMNNITGSDTNVNSKPPWEKSRPTDDADNFGFICGIGLGLIGVAGG